MVDNIMLPDLEIGYGEIDLENDLDIGAGKKAAGCLPLESLIAIYRSLSEEQKKLFLLNEVPVYMRKTVEIA